jgi:dTDP-4-amino-4,6-dideoxygalactose transaminase
VNIPCANPNAQFNSYKNEIEEAISRVINGSSYILGEEVSSFEKEFAEYLDVKYCVGVANGTDAIELAIRSLDLNTDDEVLTVSHTAVATVSAIENANVVPVLIDIEPDYYTIDPEKLKDALTSKTKVVLVVHIYGQPVDLDKITTFCKENNLYLIEDVSQAHGASWKGAKLGSFGTVSCFSFYPTKNLGALGDAGAITTNDIGIYKKIKSMRQYGWDERNRSEIKGRNSRLDEIQASILRVKLRYLDNANQNRLFRANLYLKLLSENRKIILPKVRNSGNHVFHLFVIRTKNRNELMNSLNSLGIFPGIHYPLPVHLQPAYRNKIRCNNNLGVTEMVANEILSLPLYPELENDKIIGVVDAINNS